MSFMRNDERHRHGFTRPDIVDRGGKHLVSGTHGRKLMGYMTDGLTFNALRSANLARLPEFRNKHGEPAHSQPDGSDWSPAQWLQAVTGELGEYANVRKKFERGDLTAEEFEQQAADELADVMCYLDILAFQLGIDLGTATMDKWNRISKRVGCNIRLGPNDWHRVTDTSSGDADES